MGGYIMYNEGFDFKIDEYGRTHHAQFEFIGSLEVSDVKYNEGFDPHQHLVVSYKVIDTAMFSGELNILKVTQSGAMIRMPQVRQLDFSIDDIPDAPEGSKFILTDLNLVVDNLDSPHIFCRIEYLKTGLVHSAVVLIKQLLRPAIVPRIHESANVNTIKKSDWLIKILPNSEVSGASGSMSNVIKHDGTIFTLISGIPPRIIKTNSDLKQSTNTVATDAFNTPGFLNAPTSLMIGKDRLENGELTSSVYIARIESGVQIQSRVLNESTMVFQIWTQQTRSGGGTLTELFIDASNTSYYLPAIGALNPAGQNIFNISHPYHEPNWFTGSELIGIEYDGSAIPPLELLKTGPIDRRDNQKDVYVNRSKLKDLYDERKIVEGDSYLLASGGYPELNNMLSGMNVNFDNIEVNISKTAHDNDKYYAQSTVHNFNPCLIGPGSDINSMCAIETFKFRDGYANINNVLKPGDPFNVSYSHYGIANGHVMLIITPNKGNNLASSLIQSNYVGPVSGVASHYSGLQTETKRANAMSLRNIVGVYIHINITQIRPSGYIDIVFIDSQTEYEQTLKNIFGVGEHKDYIDLMGYNTNEGALFIKIGDTASGSNYIYFDILQLTLVHNETVINSPVMKTINNDSAGGGGGGGGGPM
jgi:hypothetical protein